MDPWKSICIHNIICAEKINSLTKTEILFKGELFKCSKEDLLTNIAEINYFTKFCLMMKNKFMCFKSKSSLFSLQDPLFKIKLSDVIEIDFINKNKSKYLNLNQDFYHFYIKASNNKRDKSISTNYSSNILNPTYTETRALCRSSSSTFKKEEHKAKKGKKMSLINNKNPKSTSEIIFDCKTESINNNICTYIFGSKSLDLINKWIVVLKYFSKNN